MSKNIAKFPTAPSSSASNSLGTLGAQSQNSGLIAIAEKPIARNSTKTQHRVFKRGNRVKTTPQKARFRSVSLYKEIAYRSKLSKWLQGQQLKLKT